MPVPQEKMFFVERASCPSQILLKGLLQESISLSTVNYQKF
ncbi:hypothetical protein [Microcoleus sp. T3_D1]